VDRGRENMKVMKYALLMVEGPTGGGDRRTISWSWGVTQHRQRLRVWPVPTWLRLGFVVLWSVIENHWARPSTWVCRGATVGNLSIAFTGMSVPP